MRFGRLISQFHDIQSIIKAISNPILFSFASITEITRKIALFLSSFFVKMRLSYFSLSLLSVLLSCHPTYAVTAPTEGTPETTTGALGDAEVTYNNPYGVAYVAKFERTSQSDLEGDISFIAAEGGVGVEVTINLHNIPSEHGPFPYHVHVMPVPEDGNLTGTLMHLDPYVVSIWLLLSDIHHAIH